MSNVIHSSIKSDVPTFKQGDLVRIKLGIKAVVFGVIKELQNEQGTVLRELGDDEIIYVVGYQDNNGKLELVKVTCHVLEAYVD